MNKILRRRYKIKGTRVCKKKEDEEKMEGEGGEREWLLCTPNISFELILKSLCFKIRRYTLSQGIDLLKKLIQRNSYILNT